MNLEADPCPNGENVENTAPFVNSHNGSNDGMNAPAEHAVGNGRSFGSASGSQGVYSENSMHLSAPHYANGFDFNGGGWPYGPEPTPSSRYPEVQIQPQLETNVNGHGQPFDMTQGNLSGLDHPEEEMDSGHADEDEEDDDVHVDAEGIDHADQGQAEGASAPVPAPAAKKTKGRIKLKMKYINDKNRRCAIFRKRKGGMMKKTHEFITLTGAEALLVITSETGNTFVYATKKMQPMLTVDCSRQMLQMCLRHPEMLPPHSIITNPSLRMNPGGYLEPELSNRVTRAHAQFYSQPFRNLPQQQPMVPQNGSMRNLYWGNHMPSLAMGSYNWGGLYNGTPGVFQSMNQTMSRHMHRSMPGGMHMHPENYHQQQYQQLQTQHVRQGRQLQQAQRVLEPRPSLSGNGNGMRQVNGAVNFPLNNGTSREPGAYSLPKPPQPSNRQSGN